MALCAGGKAPWKNSEPDNDGIGDNEDNLKCFSTGNQPLFEIKWEQALLSGRLSSPWQIYYISGEKRSIITDAEMNLRLFREERKHQKWRNKEDLLENWKGFPRSPMEDPPCFHMTLSPHLQICTNKKRCLLFHSFLSQPWWSPFLCSWRRRFYTRVEAVKVYFSRCEMKRRK